jgi:hypothetical protein
MKESYGERLATDTGPESCGAACEGGVEALTGARAGWVLSRETEFLRDADAVESSGRLYQLRRYCETQQGPARSETPSTYGNTSHENREVPCSLAVDGTARRVGKSKDVRRR